MKEVVLESNLSSTFRKECQWSHSKLTPYVLPLPFSLSFPHALRHLPCQPPRLQLNVREFCSRVSGCSCEPNPDKQHSGFLHGLFKFRSDLEHDKRRRQHQGSSQLNQFPNRSGRITNHSRSLLGSNQCRRREYGHESSCGYGFY